MKNYRIREDKDVFNRSLYAVEKINDQGNWLTLDTSTTLYSAEQFARAHKKFYDNIDNEPHTVYHSIPEEE